MTFLLKNRNILYGLIILFSTYYYAHRSLKYFYLVTLTVGSVILVMYFITLITGLDLISYSQMERYRGSGMMRIGMSSYGLIVHLLPMAIVTFLVAKRRITISYRKILYFSGILMALTMLLTLSRRHILDILGMIVLGVMIISYLFNILKIKAIMKFLIPLFLLIIITSVALPKYVGHIIKITEDTLSLVATGEDTRGKGNYRISGTGDLLLVKKSIADDFLIGNGYTYLYWGNNGMATSP
ncbi:MAG: hypothetical protein KAS49_06405, partial [Candidatus Cloacimonetes bacterium]|nr:hypothetical protein [Candidatus Cloacimonadota bacterium]